MIEWAKQHPWMTFWIIVFAIWAFQDVATTILTAIIARIGK